MVMRSEEESHEEVVDVQAISAMREQMVQFENVVTLKDEIEEEFELLRGQKEQLLKKSFETAQLLEDMRSRNENNDFMIESLKRSYEVALSNANNALANQTIASNHQIRRLEKLLIQQQIQLSRLGVAYSPVVKVRSNHKIAVGESKKTIPIERRRLAYLETNSDSSDEGCAQQSPGGRALRESYLVQLEDEVLNLRIYLASEEELRRALEKERQALYDQLRHVEDDLDGIDISDEEEFIKATSSLSIEDQNISLQKTSNKRKMICSLNLLRRQCAERIYNLERVLAERSGK